MSTRRLAAAFYTLPMAAALLVAVPQCKPKQNDCQKRGGRVVTDMDRYDWNLARSPFYKAPTKCVMD